MKKNLLIFGTNTTAKSIYRFVKDYNLFNIIGFTVDKEFQEMDSFCELPVYDLEKSNKVFNKKSDLIFIAIQWNKMNTDRKKVYVRLKEQGYRFANIISPFSLIHGEIIGDNCWISDYVIIDTNSIVNCNVFVKSKAYIANDCLIHDHCFIGANSFVAGNVVIGESSFIGISATIFDDVHIGKKCLIGACTVVKRNLLDYTIVKTKSNISAIIQSSSSEIEKKLIFSKNIR
ncbi:MAG: acetyltransferase [Candidatus Lokiarchaeota archaeon]|nr:acetyltransferase [Candidatus Lokiarchaeota archaeon]